MPLSVPGYENHPPVADGRPFVKMHGLRNDFIIIDGRHDPFLPPVDVIVRLCDRREGVGGDELVILETLSDPSHADVGMRIFNPDGREAEACGNATRCVAWLLMQQSGQDHVSLETLGGLLHCRMAGDSQVAVDMGALRTDWQEIPLSHELDTLHLPLAAGPLQDPVGMNIGNPHAVFFVDDLDAVDVSRYAPRLQTDPLFPQQANIGVAQVINPTTLKLAVWERPGVLTTACGTGACAAVGADHRRGLTTSPQMTVQMPAGEVLIELTSQGTVVMTGPVAISFTGYLPHSA